MIARKVLVVSRTAGLVRDVQAAAGPGFIATHHHRVADVEEFVELKGPFDLLVAGSVFDTRAGLERLRRLGAAYPEMPVVLALAAPLRCPVPDYVRVGAVDLVELPAERRLLSAAVRRAVAARSARDRRADDAAEADSAGWGAPGALGEVVAVASPSGGCGKTFYSTNLAYYLGHTSGKRVCLVDLDLQFGEVTSALRLRPRHTMVDVVARAEEAGGVDGVDGVAPGAGPERDGADLDAYIEEYLLAHDSGFWVLPAPRHPAEADRITLADVTRLVASLRRRFDYVVIDTSAQLSEVTITALEHATALVCMATVDLPSVRNMRVFLDTLDRLGVSTDAVSVILNKVESDMGLTVEEVNEALHNKVSSVLPYAREVIRSLNQGRPVMVSDPRSDISQRLAAGMAARLGATAGPAAPHGSAATKGPAPAKGSAPANGTARPPGGGDRATPARAGGLGGALRRVFARPEPGTEVTK